MYHSVHLNEISYFFLKNPELINILPKWEKYVSDRLGKLINMRRIVIPASGTIHLAYYSENLVASPGVTWIISNIGDDDAKILCLWFNSNLHLFQLLINRIEDVWIDIHQYMLEDLDIFSPFALNPEKNKELITLFDNLSKQDFPSILAQTSNKKKRH